MVWVKNHEKKASEGKGGSSGCYGQFFQRLDVDGTPYWVEVKEGKAPRLLAALEQAIEDSSEAWDPRPPVAICHRSGGRTVAVMRVEDWVELARKNSG